MKLCRKCNLPGTFRRHDRWICRSCEAEYAKNRRALGTPGEKLVFETSELGSNPSPRTRGMAGPTIGSDPCGEGSIPSPRTLIVIPDIHFPYEDKRAVQALIEFCYDKRPDRAVQLGDAYDFYSVSNFPKKPGVETSIYADALSGLGFWRNLIETCGRVDFLPGNHEERIEKQVWANHPSLASHPAVSLRNILMLPEQVVVHPYGAKLVVEDILICHGDNLKGQRSKYPAANVLANYPNQHTVFGHLHRIDCAEKVVFNYDKARTYMSRCIGWLGDQSQPAFSYAPDASWQHGFLWVEFLPDGKFSAYQIEMFDGRFSFGGKVYGK